MKKKIETLLKTNKHLPKTLSANQIGMIKNKNYEYTKFSSHSDSK